MATETEQMLLNEVNRVSRRLAECEKARRALEAELRELRPKADCWEAQQETGLRCGFAEENVRLDAELRKAREERDNWKHEYEAACRVLTSIARMLTSHALGTRRWWQERGK